MSDIRNPRPSASRGVIRRLAPEELQLFRDHLLRLDQESRHDRFNGATDAEWVAAYAVRCFAEGAVVLAYLVEGVVRGAAEIHELSEPGRVAETAFSVDPSLQGQGIGTRLFERTVAEARRLGIRKLRVITRAENEPMKALARRFDARLVSHGFEMTGTLDLTEDLPSGQRLKSASPRRLAAKEPRRPGPAGMSR